VRENGIVLLSKNDAARLSKILRVPVEDLFRSDGGDR
jgi:hypothetical protein